MRDDLFHDVIVIIQKYGLGINMQPQPCYSFQLIFPGNLAVDDPMPVICTRHVRQCGFIGIQHFVQTGIAYCVDSDLHAMFMRAADHFCQIRRIEQGKTAAAVSTQVRLAQMCGPAAQRSVSQ